MPPGHLPSEGFCAHPTRKRAWGRVKTCWKDYKSSFGEHLGIPQEEFWLGGGIMGREMFGFLSGPPHPDKLLKMKYLVLFSLLKGQRQFTKNMWHRHWKSALPKQSSFLPFHWFLFCKDSYIMHKMYAPDCICCHFEVLRTSSGRFHLATNPVMATAKCSTKLTYMVDIFACFM